MILITGASENHAKSLRQFLQSLVTQPTKPQCYAYDLGLSAATRSLLESDYPEVVFRTFDFSKYPPHFAIAVEAGQYAWKPAIFFEVMQQHPTEYIVWCDAGNVLTGPLTPSRDLYSPISAGSMALWTHSATFAWFGISNTDPILSLPPRNGAVLGGNVGNAGVRELFTQWYICALCKDCIAPVGSDRSNHRQDQAVFSILYYQYTGNACWGANRNGVEIHRDID
jgi:hypothetical protein